MKKYWDNKNRFAVIVSKNVGSGWSTLNNKVFAHDGGFIKLLSKEGCIVNDIIHIRKYRYDKEILCSDEQIKDGLQNKINNYFGRYVFIYGLEGAEIEWLEEGTLFRVEEGNNGREFIEECTEVWYS